MTPTPPPPDALLSLPVSFWSNLPLLVCLVFAMAILIGFFVIVRENKRSAVKDRLNEDK